MQGFVVNQVLNIQVERMNIFRMKNAIRSRMGMNKSHFSTGYPTSFPYLSGDGFRSLSEFAVDNAQSFARLHTMLESQVDPVRSSFDIYIAVSFLELEKNQNLILELFNKYPKNFNGTSNLIIHNGDKIPGVNFLNAIREFFKYVYSVNITEEWGNVRAIPIGLENLHFMKNGIVNFFRDYGFKKTIGNNMTKRNLLFSSFNVETNPRIRKDVRDKILNSRFSSTFKVVPKDLYKQLLSASFFSISPPGNGPDCHRTWESIYLDVIPVVLEGSLAKSFVDNLPIHSVESYEDFLNLSDVEIMRLYQKLIMRKTDMAYLDYWHNLLKA